MSVETDVPPIAGAQPYTPPVQGQMRTESPAEPASRHSGLMKKLYGMWDVDTQDVVDRMLMALNFFSNKPFLVNGMVDSTGPSAPGAIFNGKQPDLWGPVWIYFTLVFAVFLSSTMAGLFNSIGGEYDVGMLTGNAITLFAFTFAIPTLAWFAIQYLDLVPTLTLVQTICLYGYSSIVWIPAVVVAGSPLGADAIVGTLAAILVRVTLVAAAFIVSAKFIYMNLHKTMSAQASATVSVDTRKGIVLAAGLVLHAALGFTVYFLIYQASKDLKDISTAPPSSPGE